MIEVIVSISIVILIGWSAYLHTQINKLKEKTKHDSYED